MSSVTKPIAVDKVCGKRANIAPNVKRVIDILIPLDPVLKISLGVVETTKSRGEVKVRILEEKSNETGILLKVRDASGVQEIHISTHERMHTKLAIARALCNKKIAISFH